MGDPIAFRSLFNSYKNITYSFALRVCRSKPLAEEIVQEVFMTIWITRERLSGVENFDGYLRVITRNQALQVLRRMAAENRAHSHSVKNWEEQHNETETAILYNESRHILNKALNALPPQQKLVYELCHLHGMKQRDVAEQLHISPLTVKVHLRHAVHRVREFFKTESVISVFIFFLFFFYINYSLFFAQASL